jgi:hypothetical protein
MIFAVAIAVLALQQQRPQTQADDYTRYELLAPGSQSFRIFYDVTATTPGATHYFNAIRAGAEEIVHGAYDRMTGASLQWEVIDGARARTSGHPTASPQGHFIMVKLARPVPEGGETRVRIDKTYKDSASYLVRGDTIIFTRSLGIKRNSVVLPSGYELIGVNYPSQVATEADGRIRVSFMNTSPAAVPYTVRGRKLTAQRTSTPANPAPTPTPAPTPAPAQSLAPAPRTFNERAFQDREIVYFLNPPETHSFRLYHDYTETRPGVDRYLNIVRAGSSVANPGARDLDTGKPLRVETLQGDAIRARGVDIGQPITAQTQVAVVWFDPIVQGQSMRLRIEETYTDAARYGVVGDQLVWDRGFGRPYNAMLLPAGWYLTSSSIPATVSLSDDGRIRLDYVNDRPDEIQVYVTGRRR